jgi:hypothetical protein
MALLPFMLVASLDFGVTTDERLRQDQGEAVVRYYTSGFRDRSAVEAGAGSLHGGLFDVVCVGFQRLLPGNLYVIRHFVNSLFGWLGIVFCGLVAWRLFEGPAAGLLAMALLALSPHYFASSMNNPKDLPLAAMTTVVLYYLTKVSEHPPYVSWRLAAMLSAAIALAINVRAGGILYIAYLGLLVTVLVARSKDWTLPSVTTPFVRVGLVGVSAIVLGTVFWPWAQQNPLLKPIEGLAALSLFPYYGGNALLNGAVFPANRPPLSYVPWYFAITTPPVVLAGALLSLIWLRRADRRMALAGLWFVTLFPIAFVMARRSTQYHGVRHLLFLYPSLVVLAAAGWLAVIRAAKTPAARLAAWALLAAGVAEPLLFQIRQHPNQIVYYNIFVGGPKGAEGRYDLDYWNNSVLQAVEWVASLSTDVENPIRLSGDLTDVIRGNASRFPTVSFSTSDARSHLRIVSLRRVPDSGGDIVDGGAIRFRGRDRLVVKVIRTADGVPLCVVVPGRSYRAFAGKFGLPPERLGDADDSPPS